MFFTVKSYKFLVVLRHQTQFQNKLSWEVITPISDSVDVSVFIIIIIIISFSYYFGMSEYGVYVCASLNMCAGVTVLVCNAWRSMLGVSLVIDFICLRQSLLIILYLTTWLNWLASKPQDSISVAQVLPICVRALSLLMWVKCQESKSQVLFLHSKHFIDWVISSDLVAASFNPKFHLTLKRR